MVVGGFNGTTDSKLVEVISLDPANHPVPECLKRLNDFPVTVYGAAGTMPERG